jgi:hypothetical protein
MNIGYLKEIEILERKIDIEEAYLNFDDTFEVIREFLKNIVLSGPSQKKFKFSGKAIERAIYYINKSCDYPQKVSENDFLAIKQNAWVDIENFSGLDSKLIRLVLCSLSGEKAYLHSVETDMQDDYISTFLVLAYELSPELGHNFREFVEAHPRMQKYRV